MKYTKEILEPVVKESISISEVVRKLASVTATSSHKHVSDKIKEFGIDTSHFNMNGWRIGKPSNSTLKKHFNEVLVLDRFNGRKDHGNRIKIALLESGREYKCVDCGNEGIWKDKKLKLEVDHIDGNPLNNVADNLRFMCPNCHSQTETYGYNGK